MNLLQKEGNLDPRVRRTRQLLEDALVSLLQEKPYSEITVKEIATRATVNRATFYAHFIDKEDLFRYFCRNSFKRILEETLPDASTPYEEYLNSLLTAVFEYMDFHTAKCSSAGHEGRVRLPEDELQDQLQELLVRWLERIQYDGHESAVTPTVMAVAISATVVAVARNWSRKLKLERPEAEEMKKQLRVIIFASLKAASIDTFQETSP